MIRAGETPAIGEDLYEQLSTICEAARLHATIGRNFHAAALYVVLEALKLQAENAGTAVSIYISERAAPAMNTMQKP